jgi:hypothetical protein
VRVVRRPWLDEPRQSLCQPVGLKKPKPRLDERWLPPAYSDNLVASKTMRGWEVLVVRDRAANAPGDAVVTASDVWIDHLRTGLVMRKTSLRTTAVWMNKAQHQPARLHRQAIEELYPQHCTQTPSLNTGLASVLWSRMGYNACPNFTIVTSKPKYKLDGKLRT